MTDTEYSIADKANGRKAVNGFGRVDGGEVPAVVSI
jgi:hypothetical protein